MMDNKKETMSRSHDLPTNLWWKFGLTWRLHLNQSNEISNLDKSRF